MINDIIEVVLSFLILTITAMTIQNAVLSRALGVERLISLIDDTTNTIVFGVLLTIVTMMSSVFYYLLNMFLLSDLSYRNYLKPLAMVLCMGVAFMIVFMLTVKFAPYEHLAKAVSALPVAAFNCTVIGTLLIAFSATRNYSISSTIAYGLGSSIGFMLAVLLVTEGQRKLQNRSVPSAFKGLPATLLFLAGLSMAIYGLTGHTFSF